LASSVLGHISFFKDDALFTNSMTFAHFSRGKLENLMLKKDKLL